MLNHIRNYLMDSPYEKLQNLHFSALTKFLCNKKCIFTKKIRINKKTINFNSGYHNTHCAFCCIFCTVVMITKSVAKIKTNTVFIRCIVDFVQIFFVISHAIGNSSEAFIDDRVYCRSLHCSSRIAFLMRISH